MQSALVRKPDPKMAFLRQRLILFELIQELKKYWHWIKEN